MTEDRNEQPDNDLVTVVIPARNEQGFIGACLDSILSETRFPMQVLVIDGCSSDGTASIVEAYAARDERVELLSNPERTIPKALNVGLAAARGRWLVRVDAHSTISADYLHLAIGHLRTGQWGGVGGRKDGVGLTPAGKAAAAAQASRFGIGGSQYHHTEEVAVTDHVPFGAYPTELVRALGGWDERLAVNEDFEFDYRVRAGGDQLLLDPAMRIHWHSAQSLRQLFRQYRRYGRGKAMVLALHPHSLAARHLAAPALVASWVAASLLGRRRPLLAGMLLAPYASALVGVSVRTSRRVAGRSRLYVPGAFLALHAGWGIGFWEGAFRLLRDRAPHRVGQRGDEEGTSAPGRTGGERDTALPAR